MKPKDVLLIVLPILILALFLNITNEDIWNPIVFFITAVTYVALMYIYRKRKLGS